jgi:hypothetical protein
MKKRMLLILAGAILAVGGYLVGRAHSDVVHAQSHATIAKNYGKCVGVYLKGNYVVLVFEDDAGVIRLVSAGDGALVADVSRSY